MNTQTYTDEQRLADINIAVGSIDKLLACHDEEEAHALIVDIYMRCGRIGVVVNPIQTIGQLRRRLIHRRKVETRVFGNSSGELM